MKSHIYCSFFMGSNEFALAVENVQEVVNPPTHYTQVPLSPGYLLGMFNLRGTVIPVVDLSALLNLGVSSAPSEHRKVAIIECGSSYIGLLFDRTGEVFKGHSEDLSEFGYHADNSQVISGAFKLDHGKRIIQVLDSDKLLKLDHIPRQGDGVAKTRANARSHQRGLRKQCISFCVGPAKCAIGIDAIQEILNISSIQDSALSVHHCLGTIDLRGNTVPVIDFASLLGYREPDRSLVQTDDHRRVLVMRLGDELFGLMVESVDSIITHFAEDVLPFPVLANAKQKMFMGCISREETGDVILLNHAEVLSNSEVNEITRGHSQLYKAQDRQTKDDQRSGARRTYITFNLDNVYAVGIEEVREIIEVRENLLHPPGLPGHIQGLLNLRGDLVSIVDVRRMYGLSRRELSAASRVLVFEHATGKFGLVVDSVNAIISFSESQKVKIPTSVTASAGIHSESVREAVQVSMDQGDSQTILILNVPAISQRVAA